MARIKETFNSRAWFMIECDDPNCEQRFDDSQWYADEDDLLTDAKDEGWQILYKDEHPELERDMHYCPAHRLPECTPNSNCSSLSANVSNSIADTRPVMLAPWFDTLMP